MKLNLAEQTIYTDDIARNIWKKRKAVRLSQEMLADRCGVSAQYIYLLENGKIENPGIMSLLSICKALGCNLMDLLESKGTEEVAS